VGKKKAPSVIVFVSRLVTQSNRRGERGGEGVLSSVGAALSKKRPHRGEEEGNDAEKK